MIALSDMRKLRDAQVNKETRERDIFNEQKKKLISQIEGMHDLLHNYAETITYAKENHINLDFTDGFNVLKVLPNLDINDGTQYVFKRDSESFRSSDGNHHYLENIVVAISEDINDKDVYIHFPVKEGLDFNAPAMNQDPISPQKREYQLDTLKYFIKYADHYFSELEQKVSKAMQKYGLTPHEEEEEEER